MEISSSEDEPPETSLQKALKSKKPENTLKRYILLFMASSADFFCQV